MKVVDKKAILKNWKEHTKIFLEKSLHCTHLFLRKKTIKIGINHLIDIKVLKFFNLLIERDMEDIKMKYLIFSLSLMFSHIFILYMDSYIQKLLYVNMLKYW